MPTPLTRAELATLSKNPKIIKALEEQQNAVSDTAAQTAANVDATQTINDATVITLSPNAAFNNERVLAAGRGMQILDNGAGNTLVVRTSFDLTLVGGYRLALNLPSDTTLDLPASGRVLTMQALVGGAVLTGLVNAANDAAAATAGVPVGGIYHNAGALRVRLA